MLHGYGNLYNQYICALFRQQCLIYVTTEMVKFDIFSISNTRMNNERKNQFKMDTYGHMPGRQTCLGHQSKSVRQIKAPGSPNNAITYTKFSVSLVDRSV